MSRHPNTLTMLGKWLGMGVLLVAGPAHSAAPVAYPANSVLLFVASWCAPCHAELARLAAISRGARPYRVLVVPYDRTAATQAMLETVPAAQRWQPDPAVRREVTQELAGATAGLPFSMAIDGEGRPCGTTRGGIDAAAAERLVGACRR